MTVYNTSKVSYCFFYKIPFQKNKTVILKITLQIFIILKCTFSIAQTDTLRTIPSKYIVPIESIKDQLIDDLTVTELKNKILENNIIVVGENHGVKESINAIKKIAQVRQINHFITEIDSFSINRITKYKNSSKTLLQNMPGLYGMYSYLEDMEFLNSLESSGVVCHGVDLVHPASIRLILFELSKSQNLSDKTVARLNKLIESHSKDLSKGYMSNKTERQTVKFLSKIFKNCSEVEKDHIRYVLKYRYPKNFMEARAKYMIERTSQVLQSCDVLNKNILLKFGASHTLKTYNSSGYRDVGWYINSISVQKSPNSYFLTIVPVSGVVGLSLEINNRSFKNFDFNFKYYDHLRNFYNSLDKRTNSLFVDVESFRENLDDKTVVSSELKYIIDNYDGIIFMDQVTPSKIFTKI